MPCARLQVADKAGVTDAGIDHFYKVMRAMGQWEMLDEPSPKVTRQSERVAFSSSCAPCRDFMC